MKDNKDRKDIRSFSHDELKIFFKEKGEKSFRADQVHEWLWQKCARSFDEMSNLSIATRDMLQTHFVINAISIGITSKNAKKSII